MNRSAFFLRPVAGEVESKDFHYKYNKNSSIMGFHYLQCKTTVVLRTSNSTTITLDESGADSVAYQSLDLSMVADNPNCKYC